MPPSSVAQAIGGQRTALLVVGRDETDRIPGRQRGVDDHGGDAGALRFLDRPHQRARIERGEHDAVDALAQEPFDDLDLLLAVVLANRALPGEADGHALRLVLPLRLDRAGMDALPELVRRPLRDHRHVQPADGLEVLADRLRLAATAAASGSASREGQRHHTTLEAHVRLLSPSRRA